MFLDFKLTRRHEEEDSTWQSSPVLGLGVPGICILTPEPGLAGMVGSTLQELALI